MKQLENIASILPEGLDESTVESIFRLVDETINEQVDERVGKLEAQVHAFLRAKIDTIKEQALAELSEENQTFRNATLFESVRTLMQLELGPEDQAQAVETMTVENSDLQEELDVVTEQFNALVEEHDKYDRTIAVLESKIETLEAENEVYAEETQALKAKAETLSEELQAKNAEEFTSESEKGVIIPREQINEDTQEEVYINNPFLTEDVVSLALENKGQG